MSILTSVFAYDWVATPTDGHDTSETCATQRETETSISDALSTFRSSLRTPSLDRKAHERFLSGLLNARLPPPFKSLDASRTWLIYWAAHGLALLGAPLDEHMRLRVKDTINSCQNKEGGFGGGPGQMSHVAASYAAVSAAAYAGQDAWDMIDRQALYRFLMAMKQPDGSFIMHKGGEVDVRGCYCALVMATLLNLLTPELVRGTAHFLAACQTFEGGLASAAHPLDSAQPPLGEAHGGYTFCAAASWAMVEPMLALIGESEGERLNVRALARWAAAMQGTPIEGAGFRGRANKLVDGCYSWWCGGLFPVIRALLRTDDAHYPPEIYDRVGLQEYVLLVAQQPHGGLRDKPGKPADAYHTAYNLSGLASAQHAPRRYQRSITRVSDTFDGDALLEEAPRIFESDEEVAKRPEVVRDQETDEGVVQRMRIVYANTMAWSFDESKLVIGEPENEIQPVHPLLNITTDVVDAMMRHFYRQEDSA